MNRTVRLRDEGQSLWLDYIRRRLLISGELQALIREDRLRRMTSNPSIFQEAIGGPGDYSGDRLFVHFQLTGDDTARQQKLDALEAAGHPVVRIRLTDRTDLGREMFRWEVATQRRTLPSAS